VMAILQQLNRERGITVVLVTHDENIGRHTSRILRLYDGQIVREERVPDPLLAESPEEAVKTPDPVGAQQADGGLAR